jgi:hypothetical protein
MLGLADNHCQMGKELYVAETRGPAVATGSNDLQTKLAVPLDKAGKSRYSKKLTQPLPRSFLDRLAN